MNYKISLEVNTSSNKNDMSMIYFEILQKFPEHKFELEINTFGETRIHVSDFEFYFTEEFQIYLANLQERLTTSELLMLDILPVISSIKEFINLKDSEPFLTKQEGNIILEIGINDVHSEECLAA